MVWACRALALKGIFNQFLLNELQPTWERNAHNNLWVAAKSNTIPKQTNMDMQSYNKDSLTINVFSVIHVDLYCTYSSSGLAKAMKILFTVLLVYLSIAFEFKVRSVRFEHVQTPAL